MTYWSDSQTVLSWIYSDHRKYTQFVAHRVGEILEESTMDQWRYVPTDKNPADEGTKLKKGNSIWSKGPSFLWHNEQDWPISKFPKNIENELRNTVMLHNDNTELEFIQEERYSDWNRLVKHICILKKFKDWIINRGTFNNRISFEDRQAAEEAIIKKAQTEGFPEELYDIRKNHHLTRPSIISSLVPQLNERGVLVSKSRLENAILLPQAAREPIILPYKHHITRLIMKHYHEKYLHQGDNIVLGAVHQKYWVVKHRQVLKQVKLDCQKCKNDKAKPRAPQMAALPTCRISMYAYPFTHTGVDYFGPIEVHVRRSVEKRWGVIFTCMTTRATHIELAEKLDTDSFIMNLKNFQHRRGKICHLYSDNGTNFVGAEREMIKMIGEIDKKMGKGLAAEFEIKWSFNPPAAPHFGGAWERLIQIIKKCLYEMALSRKPRLPTVEELRASLICAEYILNSRPLTNLPLDGKDDEPLTPFHFLIGRAAEFIPPYSMVVTQLSNKQYIHVQHYARYFWDRWRKEYLPTILKRNKWTEKIEPVEEGDVVVITDKESIYGKWLKGIVTKSYKRPDGQVRTVEVKTIQGTYVRPAVKVAVLDVLNKGPTNKEEQEKINHHLDGQLKNNKQINVCTIKNESMLMEDRFNSHHINYHGNATEVEDKDGKIFSKSILSKRKPPDAEKPVKVKCKIKDINDKLNLSQIKKIIRMPKIITLYHLGLIILGMLLTAVLGQQPSGLIAYDCANPEVNMTSYSLLDVSSCVPTAKNLSMTEIPIQVLQRNSKGSAMVYQCKTIIKRSIRHCGIHSHTSDYERGYAYIVKQFTPEECKRIQQTGTMPLTMDAGLHQLKVNETTRGQTLVIGSVWGSSCSGGTYKTPEYTWTGALVYYQYEVSLYNYMTTVDYENDQILLRHGIVCPYSRGQCLDSEDGYSTWDISLNQRCEETEFEVIYEGIVNKTINLDSEIKEKDTIYTSISESHLFSIRTRKAAKICGYAGYSTDHPRIFILESSEIRSPFTRKPSEVKNHDIFTYFNSKITLVENYIGQKLDEVYNSVMTELCKLDKNLLETKLTLARINPTEFVNSIMKRTGFSAVVAGEVLHVLECKPVYVQPVATDNCYQELPVKYGNITMFMTPVTRTLQPRGTEIECTPLLPAKFQFGGRWYTFDGKIREAIPPQKLTTDIITKWMYTPLPNLMESGVYDAESINKMRIMIYDQGDRRVASNVVHKILTGQNPRKQGFHFEALMSEKVIDNMINRYWEKLMSWSNWLGNITSTAIGIYMIARVIKFVVDTIMHGRILYDIYGFGWQLLAAMWDSLTSFLSHRNNRRQMENYTTRESDVEASAPLETTTTASEPPSSERTPAAMLHRDIILPVNRRGPDNHTV